MQRQHVLNTYGILRYNTVWCSYLQHTIRDLRQGSHGAKGASHHIVKRLPQSAIVDGGPGVAGPYIVQLPVMWFICVRERMEPTYVYA